MSPRRRTSLWVRVSVLGVAIAVVTGALAGGLAIGLIRGADDRSAHQVLARLADAAQTTIDNGQLVAEVRLKRKLLDAIGVQYGELTPRGLVITQFPLVRAAIDAADRTALLAGEPVSATRTVAGRSVLIEARPARQGAIVLVQERSVATAGAQRAIRRTLLAILIGVGVAALLSVLFARRLARPLRETAAAAHALAAGRRDVLVPPDRARRRSPRWPTR